MLRHRREEHGAVAIMVGVLATVLFIVAALVVDLGLARDTRRQAQNASDASVLAAANVLLPKNNACMTPLNSASPCFTDAIAAAKSYASINYGVPLSAWAGCTDSGSLLHRPDPGNTCISFDHATAPTKIRVRVPIRDVVLGLGALANDEGSIAVSADAVASVKKTGGMPYGLLALSKTCGTATMELNGNGFAIQGAVHSNAGATLNGTGSILGNLHTVGSAVVNSAFTRTTQSSGLPYVADPINETMSTWLPGSARALALGTKYHNLGSTLITRSHVTTRGAGVYYTTNGVNITGGAKLSNVTFIINRSDENEKYFNINSENPNVSLGHYIDPVNNPNNLFVFSNAAQNPCDKAHVLLEKPFDYSGVIYVPTGRVVINSESVVTGDGAIVSATLKINGQGSRTINGQALGTTEADVALLE